MTVDTLSPASIGIGPEIRQIVARLGDRLALQTREDVPLNRGTRDYFCPGPSANLLMAWMPALEGISAKLAAGATVAEVQCRNGANCVLLAQAFGNSRFHGFDADPECVTAAQTKAAEAGVAHHTTFQTAAAGDFPPAARYDLILLIDCLQEAKNRTAILTRARTALAPQGAVMVVQSHPQTDAIAQAVAAAGFATVREALRTPHHRVIEAR